MKKLLIAVAVTSVAAMGYTAALVTVSSTNAQIERGAKEW